MTRYFAKPDVWFIEGTEVFLEEDYSMPESHYFSGLFRGQYRVGSCNPKGYDIFWYDKGYKDGDVVEMTELHSSNIGFFEDFDIREES